MSANKGLVKVNVKRIEFSNYKVTEKDKIFV